MRVEVWADVMCPWCYIGKRRLESAVSQFEHADAVEVVWRSFELRPDQPTVPRATLGEVMERYRGLDGATVDKLFRWIRQLASDEGLEMNLDGVRPVRSFDAHRVIHLARAAGLADAMAERLFRAHLTENANVADHDVLVGAGEEVGLEAAAVRAALAEDGCADQVRADEARAVELGVSAVPTFVVDGRYRIAGSPPADDLLGLLRQGWATVGG